MRIAKTKKKYFYKIYSWIIKAVKLQIVLTTISLPILIGWGLPVSLISILGNIIFAPFFVIFLFFSSLIFITQLLNIPNKIFIYILEFIEKIWLSLTNLAGDNVLLNFPCPPKFILFLILFFAFFILCLKSKFRYLNLFIFFVLSCLFLKLLTPKNKILEINHNTKSLIFIKIQDNLICVDQGVKDNKIEGYFYRKILPEIHKNFGSIKVHYLIFLKPTTTSYKLAKLLLDNNSKNNLTNKINSPSLISNFKSIINKIILNIKTKLSANKINLHNKTNLSDDKINLIQNLTPKIIIPRFSEYIPEKTKLSLDSLIDIAKTQSIDLEIINTKDHDKIIFKNKDSILKIHIDGQFIRTKNFQHLAFSIYGNLGKNLINVKPILTKSEKII